MSWEDAFNQRESEKEEWLAKRPVCCMCHEQIQDDTAYLMPGTDDDLVCPTCMAELQSQLVWIDENGEWE